MTGAWIILAVTIAIGVLLWAWEKFRTQKHGHTLHHHAPQRPTPNAQRPTPNADNAEIADNADNGQRTTDNGQRKTKNEKRPTQNAICCGLHAICEKTGQINEPPVYYDDEELDRFAGRAPGDYSDAETEEFRDVLLTLLPSDAPGWAVSLEKRRINLPETLLPELELLLSES